MNDDTCNSQLRPSRAAADGNSTRKNLALAIRCDVLVNCRLTGIVGAVYKAFGSTPSHSTLSRIQLLKADLEPEVSLQISCSVLFGGQRCSMLARYKHVVPPSRAPCPTSPTTIPIGYTEGLTYLCLRQELAKALTSLSPEINQVDGRLPLNVCNLRKHSRA